MATDGKSAAMAAAEVPEDDLGEPDVKVCGGLVLVLLAAIGADARCGGGRSSCWATRPWASPSSSSAS